jgi:SWI/SNF-related matrix-associated actin-dependent regulator 1 of chromatin subfamily A
VTWNIPIGRFRAVKAALANPSNPFRVQFECTPDPVLNAVLAMRPKPTTPSDLNSLPKKLLASLFPHQRESVLFAISRGFRVLVADDMGLGKTIEAIAMACTAGFPHKIRVLVMSPNNLSTQWVDSFLEWTDICPSSINVVHKAENLAQTPLTIVPFSTVVRIADQLPRIGYDMIILDESHELKNPKTQLYKTLLPIMSKVKYLLLLSGTPTLNRPAELFPQLQLLLPHVFSSFKLYAFRYCRGTFDQFGHIQSSGSSHAAELRVVLEHLVMIRRQKTDVLNDLPAKKRVHVKLEFAPTRQLKDMIDVIRAQRMSLSVGMDSMKCEQSIVITKAFALTAKEKLPVVLRWFCSAEFRKSFFHDSRKCLVFAHHLVLLNGMRDWMVEQGVGCIFVTGATTRDQREAQFAQFRSDPECRVAVLSIEIAGTGLTLVEASMVVFAELKWTPAEHQQAEDRVHRIGQSRDVEIFYLHALGSIDDRIWEILETKLAMLSSVIATNTKSFETNLDAK